MSVFISYSRRDTDFVDLLHRLLESKGYDAWLDRSDISVGSQWDNSVQQAIEDRTHMIVVLSPDSVNSENVADEWNFARDKSKTIIPIYYRDCDVPMRLSRYQRVDFLRQSFADAFKELVSALGQPDARPQDALELAKRQGLVFVKGPIGFSIAFIYLVFPKASDFVNTVWYTLLWQVIPRGQYEWGYDYGIRWILRNRDTNEEYSKPEPDALLHEMGIEPDTRLEIVLLDTDKD